MALDRDAERVLELVWSSSLLRRPADMEGWRASPLRTPDLSGVAPAFVLTAGYDVLCDKGEAYVQRLQQAGVPVQFRHFSEQIPGFLTMGKIVQAAQPALDELTAALRAAWGPP